MFLPGAGCGERLVTVRRRDPEFGPGPSAGPDRRTATVRSFFDVGDAELSATDGGLEAPVIERVALPVRAVTPPAFLPSVINFHGDDDGPT